MVSHTHVGPPWLTENAIVPIRAEGWHVQFRVLRYHQGTAHDTPQEQITPYHQVDPRATVATFAEISLLDPHPRTATHRHVRRCGGVVARLSARMFSFQRR